MSEANAKRRRRWFQFSLRTLLIVVTLAAGLLVAWRAYVEPYGRQREVMALIKDLNGGYETEPGEVPAGSPLFFRNGRSRNRINRCLTSPASFTAATAMFPVNEIRNSSSSRLKGVWFINFPFG